jgi:hypothetical protein
MSAQGLTTDRPRSRTGMPRYPGRAALHLVMLILAVSFTQHDCRARDTATVDSLAGSGVSPWKYAAFVTGYVGLSMYALGQSWYKDRARVPFHFYNDNAAWLQMDKFGHAYGAYVYSYLGYHGMLAAGMRREDALAYGATLGIVLQTPIEIMDGLHEGYGFSWGDIIANTLGSSLVLGQELLFREQIVTFKFSYRQSPYPAYAEGDLGRGTFDRMLKDYNGQGYWLCFPLDVVSADRGIPSWLSVAIGYGAGGMYGEFDNERAHSRVGVPRADRHRRYLLSLDIDWRRIKTDSTLLRLVFHALTFIKFPFPALELSSPGEIRGHWIYF